MRGRQKTLASGTEGCVALEAREVYPRSPLDSVLPNNWNRCRIGLFFSLIGLDAGDNTDPVAETVAYVNSRDLLQIGISNGVQGYGVTGNRFVGGVSSVTTPIAAAYNGSGAYWNPLGSGAPLMAIGDGTTIASASISNATPFSACRHKAPSGQADFAAYFGLDITLTTTGAIVQMMGAPAVSPYGITDTSLPNLIKYMMETTRYGTAVLTGGWWSGGTIGMSKVHVRFPHLQNRARLHRLAVLNLSTPTMA